MCVCVCVTFRQLATVKFLDDDDDDDVVITPLLITTTAGWKEKQKLSSYSSYSATDWWVLFSFRISFSPGLPSTNDFPSFYAAVCAIDNRETVTGMGGVRGAVTLFALAPSNPTLGFHSSCFALVVDCRLFVCLFVVCAPCSTTTILRVCVCVCCVYPPSAFVGRERE